MYSLDMVEDRNDRGRFFERILHILRATRWRSQPTMGATSGGVFRLPTQSPVFCPARLRICSWKGPTIDAALVALKPHVRQPLWTWCAGLSVRLPPEPDGTLVVRNVSRLDRDQQQQLVDWLHVAAGRVQVISTASEPLFALVEHGIFLDVLYYRLNVVRVELTTE
jgi:hypothetical protein